MSPNAAVPVLTTCGGVAAFGFLPPKRWKRTRTSRTSPTIPTMRRTRFLLGDAETFSAFALIGLLHYEIQLAWNTAPRIRSSDTIAGHRCTAILILGDWLDRRPKTRARPRQSLGDCPVQRRNARVKQLPAENPSKYVTSLTLCLGALK